jgi:hypothetical protein
MWSPELDTLDQLCDGDMPLAVVRKIFDDEARFARAIAAMLDAKEIRLTNDDVDVPRWQWREMLTNPDRWRLDQPRVSITNIGTKRMGA